MSVGYEYEDCNCHPWCSDPSRDEFIRAAEDGRKGRLPTLEECIERVTERRPVDAGGGGNVTDFAKPAKCSPALNETGEGQSGLRTELVTLEVTHRFEDPIASVLLQALDSVLSGQGESVFVMDGSCEITKLTAERDAAIRERDEVRKKLNRCPECNGEGKHDSGGTDASGEWINLPCEGCGSTGTIHGYFGATDRLRARVAELESSPAASGAAGSSEKEFLWCDGCGSSFECHESSGGKRRMVEPDNAFGPEQWENLCASCFALEAASGAAGTEVVAWAVVYPGGRFGASFDTEAQARSLAKRLSLYELSVAPLYAAPQPAKGWLTEEERSLIESLEGTFQQNADALRSQGLHGHVDNWERKVKLFRSILARSSTPEVVLPRDCGGESYDSFVAGWNNYRDEALKALAAAGVTVKEVGSE